MLESRDIGLDDVGLDVRVKEDVEPEVVDHSGLCIALQGRQCFVVRFIPTALRFTCCDLLSCGRSSA